MGKQFKNSNIMVYTKVDGKKLDELMLEQYPQVIYDADQQEAFLKNYKGSLEKQNRVVRNFVSFIQARDGFIATGYYTICNTFGIEIQINNSGDGIRYRKDKANKPSRWQEIKYTKSGRSYFRMHNRRIYLDEYLKAC